jgi:GT2 family glycosyltransferase
MKISIIILSFNHYDTTTGMCLEHLSRDPSFNNWEVIVADNASDAATREKLNLAAQQYPNVKLVLNSANLGFSAGNNVGIRLATGDCIILLNSDAFAPPGMLDKLAAHLAADNRLGMLGPVTNAAGNEQCIHTTKGDMDAAFREGIAYAQNGGNEILSAYRLDFCCVAIPRRVLDEIGLLDEEFGRGYFEDFDYSLRVKQAGYTLGIAEDSFVYHRGSSSFGKVPREIKELMKRNKKLVLRKHPHGVEFPHKRAANLSVLTQYLARQRSGVSAPMFRLKNRLALAYAELPKSWFKRWRYLRSVAALEKQTQAF